ncbi:MAG: heparinase II/III domain-containing protein, partial [Planctomycetota bacterium]
QDATEDAVAVAVTFGNYANAHSHPDQLSITLYANGYLMAPDMKEHSYGHEGHIGWAKQTIAHNTVTVDEVSQYPQRDHNDVWVGDTKEQPAFGTLVLFHPGEQLKAFRGLTDSVYEGVVLDRTIVLVDSVVVDFYRCRSANQHQYDLALHVDGELAETDVEFGEIEDELLSEQFGYNNLIDVQRANAPGVPVQLTYRAPEPGPAMHVTLLPDGPVELITAMGYPNRAGRRRSALITRRSGTNVDFVRVMNFEGVGNVAAINRLNLPDGLMGVRIVRADGQTDVVISAERSGTYTVLGETFTGQVALFLSIEGTSALVDVAE